MRVRRTGRSSSTQKETARPLQKNLLRSWPEGGPEVLWRVPVGIGYGGPVIKDGKVYLLDRDDASGDKMRCFDFSTGEELWNYEYVAPGSASG